MTSLETLAEQEWRGLIGRLASKWHSRHPVSVHLFQPITAPHCDKGRLVDVGPRPRHATQGLCWQPASAGATGRFLDDPSASLSQIPFIERYNKSQIASYRRSMPEAERRQQVALEKLRHAPSGRIKTWIVDDSPPEGIYSWHLSLSPPVKNVETTRWPSVGSVYTLTQDRESDDICRRLVHFAQVAGQEAVRNRLDHLFQFETERYFETLL